MTHSHPFVIERGDDGEERSILHDHYADPFQLENVADREVERVRDLEREVYQWCARIDDPWLSTSGEVTPGATA